MRRSAVCGDAQTASARFSSRASSRAPTFANSISTTKGGTHVTVIADQIAKALITSIQRKNKGAQIKPAHIKAQMWIFVDALIVNPTFDSQTKEQLTLPASKFGSKPNLSEEFMKKGMFTILCVVD